VYRRRALLTVVGAGMVTVALLAELAGRRAQFTAALHTAPLLTLALVAALQVGALLARSEAWHVCVEAAGGSVSRRLLFRAAGIGYLASIFNGSVGLAARIACLRRVAPDQVPRVPALLAAEVPIIAVEVGLVAIFSFTLVGPLGIPWWTPVLAISLMTAATLVLRRVSDRHRLGLWSGLAVMRHGRYRMIAFVLLAIVAQIARNYLVLRAVGVHVSVIDATALLIAMFTLGQLPIGPSLGAAAAVLILGAHGVAATAAAGLLLTVTATAGSLCYAAWAILDRALAGRPRKLELATAPASA
jgi:uncharacterized membrane protein YbhN (UPF0104 family)